jgi:hypothetical protein
MGYACEQKVSASANQACIIKGRTGMSREGTLPRAKSKGMLNKNQGLAKPAPRANLVRRENIIRG